MSGKLKGQFFLISAILLSVMFFLGMPVAMNTSSQQTSDIEAMGRNLEREIPESINLAIMETGEPRDIGTFLDFIKQGTEDRLMEVEILWVVIAPDQDNPGTVTVYSGNWLGKGALVNIDIDGNVVSRNLNDQETSSDTIAGISPSYEMEVSFGGRTWSENYSRDKVNHYSYISISKGENKIVKDISG